MAEYRIPYGQGYQKLVLPDEFSVTMLTAAEAEPVANPRKAVADALQHPLGHSLADYGQVDSAAIAINDKTRPVPLGDLLPPLLDCLHQMGLPPEKITFLIATGTHVPMPREEFARVVPEEILARYPIYSHDCDDRGNLVFTGRTTRGTQVWTNKRYVDAQLRICIGDIEAHQFMGFSGGVKSAAVGLTSRETINHNHAMMTHPLARAGGYEDNPVRQDLEEIGKLIGIHFALNSILNEQKQIVRVLAGDPVAVMEAGVPLVRELYGIVVDRALDLVVVSPGGHPKDINLYQAQKGLAHACLVTKECGAVVVAAACPEGSGSAGYERWMEGMTSHQAVLDRFAREDFRIGPHKGFQVARDSMCRRVIWVSDQPDQTVSRWLLEPAPDVQTAVERILPDLPGDARIGIMPAGNTTIPRIR